MVRFQEDADGKIITREQAVWERESLLKSQQEKSKKVLYARVNWLETYVGEEWDKPIENPDQNLPERFNFKLIAGRLYGSFAEGVTPKVLREVDKKLEPEEEILLVLFSRQPDTGDNLVVGFYAEAKLFQTPQFLPAHLTEQRAKESYTFEANSQSAGLLHPEKRRLPKSDATMSPSIFEVISEDVILLDHTSAGALALLYNSAKAIQQFTEDLNILPQVNYHHNSNGSPQLWFVHNNKRHWEEAFQEEQIVALGWPGANPQGLITKEDYKEKLDKIYPNNKSQTLGTWANYYRKMRFSMREGDYVVHRLKSDEYQIGLITSGYDYDRNKYSEYPNFRKVKWLQKVQVSALSKLSQSRLGVNRTLFKVHEEAQEELFQLMELDQSIWSRSIKWLKPTSSLEQLTLSDESRPVLGVTHLAGKIKTLLENIDKPAVLGLFGQWGRGKSYFLEQLTGQLDDYRKGQLRQAYYAREDKPLYRTLSFNAWKYQDTKAIWAYLHDEILEAYLTDEVRWPYAGLCTLVGFGFFIAAWPFLLQPFYLPIETIADQLLMPPNILKEYNEGKFPDWFGAFQTFCWSIGGIAAIYFGLLTRAYLKKRDHSPLCRTLGFFAREFWRPFRLAGPRPNGKRSSHGFWLF